MTQNARSKSLTNKSLYTYQDLMKFMTLEPYSSFGQKTNPQKSSAPKYSIGTSQRTDLQYLGKNGPKNPDYDLTDKFMYSRSPTCKIGTSPKNSVIKQTKYDHYMRKDIDFQTANADLQRRASIPSARIGAASRFPHEEKSHQRTPGPQYYPNIRQQIEESPKYTISPRRNRKGDDPFISLSSTLDLVGPGSYRPEDSANKSSQIYSPTWSIPKSIRKSFQTKNFDKNQTYQQSSSLGKQKLSGKPSKQAQSIGKQKRWERKSNIFSAHMEQKPTSVRLQLPRF